VTVLVSQYDRKRQAVNLRLGDQWAVLQDSNTKAVKGFSMAALRPGDVVQVRLLSRDRKSKVWTAELIAAPMVQAAVMSMELKTGKVRCCGRRASATAPSTGPPRLGGSQRFKPVICRCHRAGFGPIPPAG
jgi:hypothetical protein